VGVVKAGPQVNCEVFRPSGVMATQTPTDEELARQTRAGSDEAFEELVRRYEHRVFAFAAQYLPNRQDAREVTQDAFVKAFRAIAQFDPQRGFAPWLFAIARRICIDRHRATRTLGDEPLPELVDYSSPDQSIVLDEERAALWALARKLLPSLQYDALWLRYAQEMNVAQIAQVLRKTRIHVKVLLFRARQTLSLHLKTWQGSRPPPDTRSLGRRIPPSRATQHLVPLPGQNEGL
jgi:RNA polymerase sigma-70 factor, ECF subfamily